MIVLSKLATTKPGIRLSQGPVDSWTHYYIKYIKCSYYLGQSTQIASISTKVTVFSLSLSKVPYRNVDKNS